MTKTMLGFLQVSFNLAVRSAVIITIDTVNMLNMYQLLEANNLIGHDFLDMFRNTFQQMASFEHTTVNVV